MQYNEMLARTVYMYNACVYVCTHHHVIPAQLFLYFFCFLMLHIPLTHGTVSPQSSVAVCGNRTHMFRLASHTTKHNNKVLDAMDDGYTALMSYKYNNSHAS